MPNKIYSKLFPMSHWHDNVNFLSTVLLLEIWCSTSLWKPSLQLPWNKPFPKICYSFQWGIQFRDSWGCGCIFNDEISNIDIAFFVRNLLEKSVPSNCFSTYTTCNIDYSIPPQSHTVDYKPNTILELQKAGWYQEELSYLEFSILASASASWNKNDIWRKQ